MSDQEFTEAHETKSFDGKCLFVNGDEFKAIFYFNSLFKFFMNS